MSRQEEFEIAVRSNDLYKLKNLLNIDKISPVKFNFYAIGYAAQHGYSEIVELLLKDPNVNPTKWFNAAIRSAIERKHTTCVELLWADQRVKDNLLQNDESIYKILMKEYVGKKINKF